MFNTVDQDPLGISRQSRGMQSRFEYQQQHPGTSLGPLPSAAWEGLFQAMQDNGVNHVAQGNMGAGQTGGLRTDPNQPHFDSLPSTYNPAFQQSALSGLRQASPLRK